MPGGGVPWLLSGGILEVAGIPGFLQNLDEFYEQVTHEATEVYAFVAEWWEHHKSEPLPSKDLIPLADEVGLDLEAMTDRGRGIGFASANCWPNSETAGTP